MSVTLADISGLVGVIFILIGYALLQFNKVTAKNLSYSVLNFVGSLLLFISLLYTWNLASIVIECAWMGISAYGIIKCLISKKA